MTSLRRITQILMIGAVLMTQPIRPALAKADQAPAVGSAVIVDHAVWTNLLSRYVKAHQDGVNRFDYAAVDADDKAMLARYLTRLEAIEISNASDKVRMAYWINLYNALTVRVILDHYPVRSIRQIRSGLFSIGPWKQKRVTVEGESLSLDDIEHKKLRAQFGDPRIHYAVNCASWGCPSLMAQAYTGAQLDQLLDQGARDYINHPRGVDLTADGRLIVSKIYKWFKEDFGTVDVQVLAHIRRYSNPDLLELLKDIQRISGYEYDWTLNSPEFSKGDY